MRKILQIFFWIIAFFLFPITAGLYFIWPGRIFKERLSKSWTRFWWIIYGFVAFFGITSKICFSILVLIIADGYSREPVISYEDFQPSEYRTAEDFRKLTGVEFPELEMIDSLYYNENIIHANTWNEYRFVLNGGLNDAFYKRLDCACKADSCHWIYDKEEGIYRYVIYPDQHPVDRSRGMCDRMVTMDNGRQVNDWEGDFISVIIERDTIVLRNGWIR